MRLSRLAFMPAIKSPLAILLFLKATLFWFFPFSAFGGSSIDYCGQHPIPESGALHSNFLIYFQKIKFQQLKQHLITTTVILILMLALSSFAVLISSFQPPQGYAGDNGVYCTNCHGGNSLNSAGGSVTINGLPDAGYTPGSSYTFSLTTTHAAINRMRWGFSVIAKNNNGQVVGSFSTTNANAAINGNELSHNSAVVTAAQSSYTYDKLSWTAPAINEVAGNESITFYFAANAANGTGSPAGDFIYAGTKTINLLVAQTYTFTGNGNWSEPSNWSNNTIPPAVLNDAATIIIDPPSGGECVLNIEQRVGTNVTLKVNDGKKFRILGNLVITNQ